VTVVAAAINLGVPRERPGRNDADDDGDTEPPADPGAGALKMRIKSAQLLGSGALGKS